MTTQLEVAASSTEEASATNGCGGLKRPSFDPGATTLCGRRGGLREEVEAHVRERGEVAEPARARRWEGAGCGYRG